MRFSFASSSKPTGSIHTSLKKLPRLWEIKECVVFAFFICRTGTDTLCRYYQSVCFSVSLPLLALRASVIGASISAGASTITNLLPIRLILQRLRRCLLVLSVFLSLLVGIYLRLCPCTFFGLFVLANAFVTLSASWSESDSVSPMLKKVTSGVTFFFRSLFGGFFPSAATGNILGGGPSLF